MDRKDLIEKLRILPNKIADLVSGLSDSDLTTHFMLKEDGSPEWTVAQNVHHLADAHMNAYVRCKRMMTEENLQSRPYAQDGWAASPEAQSADLSYSLAILRGLHDKWSYFWHNLEQGDWLRSGTNSAGHSFTLEDQLRVYVKHGEAHFDQIQRTLAAKK